MSRERRWGRGSYTSWLNSANIMFEGKACKVGELSGRSCLSSDSRLQFAKTMSHEVSENDLNRGGWGKAILYQD